MGCVPVRYMDFRRAVGKFPEQLGDGWGVNGGHVNPACLNGTTLKGAILLQPGAFRGCWGLALTGSRSKVHVTSRDRGRAWCPIFVGDLTARDRW